MNDDDEKYLALVRAHPDYYVLEPTVCLLRPEPGMKEPDNCGAIVVDQAGTRLLRVRRISNGSHWYDFAETRNSWRWDQIQNPQPFYLCELSATDPQPPPSSVVRSERGIVWVRGNTDRWHAAGWSAHMWQAVLEIGPVTLLHRGERDA